MRERTAELHTAAERSGIVGGLLTGQISRLHYALYLRNLLPVYQALERALSQQQDRPRFAGLADPSLYRAESIVSDLNHLAGTNWAASLPLLPAGERYARRVEWAGTGALLIAHCYTRYLGDLNGGQVMGRRLEPLFGTGYQGLFTLFPAIQNTSVFARTYRAALDQAGDKLDDTALVVEEAAVAFQFNIELSQQVMPATGYVAKELDRVRAARSA